MSFDQDARLASLLDHPALACVAISGRDVKDGAYQSHNMMSSAYLEHGQLQRLEDAHLEGLIERYYLSVVLASSARIVSRTRAAPVLACVPGL